ncbi:MAG: hypothetical protein ABIP20_00620 [Chthoniobacteraceae bacterium]
MVADLAVMLFQHNRTLIGLKSRPKIIELIGYKSEFDAETPIRWPKCLSMLGILQATGFHFLFSPFFQESVALSASLLNL